MQISEINNLNSNQQLEASKGPHLVGVSNKESNKEVGELRAINMPLPTYGNPNGQFNKETVLDKIEADKATGFEMSSRVNTALALSGNDYARMKEEGINPDDLEEKEFVDIADKIRIAMAKGGADISMMGDISDAALKSLGSNSVITKNALEQLNLPNYNDNVRDVMSAVNKVNDVLENAIVTEDKKSLSTETIKYMLSNDLEPTIDSIYKATISSNNASQATPMEIAGDMENINAQFEDIIREAGLPVDEKNMSNCKYLLENRIDISPNKLIEMNELQELDLNDLSSENVMNHIVDALVEGKKAGEAYLVKGYSLHEEARDIYNAVNKVTEADIENVIEKQEDITIGDLVSISENEEQIDKVNNNEKSVYEGNVNIDKNNVSQALDAVTAKKQLVELQLQMTVTANYTLMKNGIKLDTLSMQQYVDELEQLEKEFVQSMLKDKATPENIALLNETINTVDDLSDQSAFSIGEMENVSAMTLTEMYEFSVSYSARMVDVEEQLVTVSSAENNAVNDKVDMSLGKQIQRAATKYETTGTEVRRDLGDSIHKAFRNVDAMLEDLDLEVNDDNRRAVRILGYNQMEITKENIQEVKSNDLVIQRVLGNLKPGVVCEMIKAGQNPLDMSMEELDQTSREIIASNEASSEEEKFSEFLWKLEQQNGITKEERDGFIGVYRLIHQVNKTDGAAIGMLLEQGAPVTMRNLYMAVKTSKHENREYTVDDDFGGIEAIRDSLSIIDQIEMSIQSSSLKQVEERITPNKLTHFQDENEFMSLTPEQLNSKLEGFEQEESVRAYEEALDNSYEEIRREELVTNLKADKVAYEFLEANNMPVTANTLSAVTAFMSDNNSLKTLLSKAAKRQVGLDRDGSYAEETNMENAIVEEDINDSIENILKNLIHEYGEACKTPSDMAEAEQRLEEMAENVMKNMLVSEDVSSIDVRGMHLIQTQIHTMGQVAQRSENYTIPIMVADEVGNMSLKIVRGKEEKGIVDIAFNMEKTGSVTASFRYEAGEFTGKIESDSNKTRRLLEENVNGLREAIFKETNVNASLEFAWSKTVDKMNIFTNEDVDFETENIYQDGELDPSVNVSVMTKTLYGVAKAFIDELGCLA